MTTHSVLNRTKLQPGLKPYQQQWDRIAQKYASIEDEARIYLLHPAILKTFKEIEKGLKRYARILDFGCGDGRLACELTLPTKEIVAVDSSPRMIQLAKQRAAEQGVTIEFLRGDQELVNSKYDSYFDAAIASLVLMTVPDGDEIVSILNALYKAVKYEGRVIIAVTHPAFTVNRFSSARATFPNDFKYNKSGTPYRVMLEGKDGERVSFYDYHWTIQDYSKFIEAANLIIHHINELYDAGRPILSEMQPREDTTSSPNPMYLIFHCIKIKPGSDFTSYKGQKTKHTHFFETSF